MSTISLKKISGFTLCTSFVILFLMVSCKKSMVNNEPMEPYPIDHVAHGTQAMVVSANPLATQIGLDILKQGGNAVDAAIAVQFALAVTYPRAGNIGGGGFMIIRDAEGQSFALDYREQAPAAAHRDMYLDSLGQVIPKLSVDGHRAVGIPGTVKGMYVAWDSLGQIPKFSQLLIPAFKLSLTGFQINSAEAKRLNKFQPDFKKYHSSNSPFLKLEWETGDNFIQSDLAATLNRIIKKENASGFYQGETSDLIIQEMKRGGGVITKKDLLTYEAVWRKPQIGYYRDNKIISMPPPSSGGIALLQLFEIVEQFDIKSMTHQNVAYVHLLAEAERRVYADRAKFLGDTDFIDVPVKKLLDSIYLMERMANYNSAVATKSEDVGAGDIDIQLESFETTHTSVVDAQGMAVSVTTTLNLNYGSKVLVNGAGFLLNNEMDDFSAKPGVPNSFGLIGNEANAIQPKKRMLSSMAPTIVESAGELLMVVGTPGGSTIITSVFQVILNVLEHDMPLDEAVFAPRFHHQWLPDKIFTEPDMWTTSMRDSLNKMGHKFDQYERIGLVKAIKVKEDGSLIGVGDKRTQDHAAGY